MHGSSLTRCPGVGIAMITVDEYLAMILNAVRPVEERTVELADALGATLREAVRPAIDLPPFDNSAMDGFAVRFADVVDASAQTPALLRVVADLPAGSSIDPMLGPGEAARIMTGSPMPSAADTVVPFEATEGGLEDSLGVVRVRDAPSREGAHVRGRGEDRRAGSELVPAGVALGGLQLSVIASANLDRVTVSRRPRVAVISTGSELVQPGSELARGQIPESNALLLGALATEAGAEAVLRRTVADVDNDLRQALADAERLEADAVITSGGISAGAYEVVKTAVGHMRFEQVAMQPGRPQGFRVGPPLVFGLPGNPLSAAVSFEAFVRPALLAMQLRSVIHRPVLRLPVVVGWRVPHGRQQYAPIVLTGGGVAPAGRSHGIGGIARLDGYAIVPIDVGDVAEGDLVDVMLIS
jgi:molybdopterin molybdotransferase